jgi:hypothetical protein
MNLSDFEKEELEEAIDYYLSFLQMRMDVWYRKEIRKSPPPWTEDEILQHAYFTNIYRELDKNSRYELAFLNDEKDPKMQLFKICLFRHSNAPKTFEFLIQNPSASVEDIYEFRSTVSGREFFSDAMMSPPGKDPKTGRRVTRPEWVLLYRQFLLEDLDSLYENLLKASDGWECLKLLQSPRRRIGPFFAYEMYTSLTYCHWFPMTEDDAYVIGPGAFPALNILRGSHEKFPELRDQIYEALLLRDFYWIPYEFQPCKRYEKKFTLRTFEHSLCEWRKHMKVRDWGKSSKRVYRYLGPLKNTQ